MGAIYRSSKILKLGAIFLFLIGCSHAKYDTYKEINKVPERFEKDSVDQYLLTQYKTEGIEKIHILYFKEGLVIGESIQEGSRHRASVPILTIIADCYKIGCNQVLFSHNHVGCYFAHPSETDFNTTELLKDRFKTVNITLIAHVVVADHDTYWIR